VNLSEDFWKTVVAGVRRVKVFKHLKLFEGFCKECEKEVSF
jgi:hypothetical protein